MSENWIAGPVVCTICGRRWTAVRPETTTQNLECPGCGHMTGAPVDEAEDGDE